jgi:hypothetical protein
MVDITGEPWYRNPQERAETLAHQRKPKVRGWRFDFFSFMIGFYTGVFALVMMSVLEEISR